MIDSHTWTFERHSNNIPFLPFSVRVRLKFSLLRIGDCFEPVFDFFVLVYLGVCYLGVYLVFDVWEFEFSLPKVSVRAPWSCRGRLTRHIGLP